MTVKTQGGKVILKDGRVSCSCCEEEGCLQYRLYSANLYGVKYEINDLPDSIDATIVGGNQYSLGERFTLLKNSTLETTPGTETPFYVESGFFDIVETDEGVDYYRGGLGIVIIDQNWRHARYGGNSEDGWQTSPSWAESIPLIANQNLQEGDQNIRVLDFFANSFSVSGPSFSVVVVRQTEPDTQWGGEFPDFSSETVPKLLFCEIGPEDFQPYASPGRWSGSGAQLYFSDIYDVAADTGVESDSVWKIKIGSDVYVKSGDQNTPVGTYEGGFTVS